MTDGEGMARAGENGLPVLTGPWLELFEAWQRWRRGNLVPTRSEMALHEVSNLLPMLLIMEIRSADDVTIRLAGTAISAMFGQDLVGQNYLEMVPPDVRRIRSLRLTRQVGQPCGALLRSRASSRHGLEFNLQGIGLPVRPDDPAAPMQLLSLVASLEMQFLPENIADAPLNRLADLHRFFDIGAGVPPDPA